MILVFKRTEQKR